MIQPNLYPLHFSHNFSTDLIKEAVVRYRTHPLRESAMKMECLQAVQIKGCGLTVLESDIFFQYRIFLVFIQENQEKGGGYTKMQISHRTQGEESFGMGPGEISSSTLHANWCCHCACVCYATMLLSFHGYSFPT